MKAWLIFALLPVLAACGFHLRGRESVELPPALARLWVDMGTRPAYAPLLVEMRNALITQTHIELADAAPGAAVLTLFGETFLSEPELALNTITRAAVTSGYILSYKVSYRLLDGSGAVLVPGQTVKLQRQYDFDPNNVVAKEKEQDYLRSEMQRDAVQQILRQLAALASRTP